MMRAAAFAAILVLVPTFARPSDAVTAAQTASDGLNRAAERLAGADRARDRVAALTETVRAYEDGLAALRGGMRQAALQERAIAAEFAEREERLSRLLGALLSMQTSPEALVLLHPDGPLASTRAGMLAADATPILNTEVARLRKELEELALLRALQEAARGTLQAGLDGVQEARTALSQAISERHASADLTPADATTLQALVNSADTLQGFASTLATLDAEPQAAGDGFAATKGHLQSPARGTVVASYGAADETGERSPGVLLSTAPRAIVTAPHAVTVRYSGPLLDLGMVVILEPEAGYLLILSGLGQAFPEAGAVLDAGDPVGLMPGATPSVEEILIEAGEDGGQGRRETLYIELREGESRLDPADWFELTENKDKS